MTPPVTRAGGGTPTPRQSASDIVARHSDTMRTMKVVQIDGYSGWAKCLGTGRHITSVAFYAGGYKWCAKIYPDGKNSSDAGWVSVYLHIQADSTDADRRTAMVRYSIRLLDQDGQEVPSYSTTWTRLFPLPPGEERGCRRFIEGDALKGYLGDDDRFRVTCDIVVYHMYAEPAAVAPRPRPVVVAPSDLHRQLLALLSSGRGGDVTLSVGGELFTAHKYMLAARSPVFMAELFGQMQAENSPVVRVDDMELSVFEAMLEFIYTDSLPEIDGSEMVEMAQHLLVAADRYDLQRLKSICEDKLCDNIDTRTVATTLTLAEQHGCHVLKEACMYYLSSPGNLEAVMVSDGFPHLTESCPALHMDIVDQTKSVSHVLKIIGYSNTKTLGGYHNCLTSTVFVVGGRRWCVEYYPDGHNSEHAGWISVFVGLDRSDATPATAAKAQYEISLLALDGSPVASYRITSKKPCKFSRRKTEGGELVKRKVLEESGHLNEDAFSIRCDITMAK